MKKLYTATLLLLLGAGKISAQHGKMLFVGPAKLGVEAFNSWQDNPSDTVRLTLKDITAAEIQIPRTTFNQMGMSMPSFTVPVTMQMNDDRNFEIPKQSYETEVNGKTMKVAELSGIYLHASQELQLNVRFSYGAMPVEASWSGTFKYDKKATSITPVVITSNKSKQAFDLQGRKVDANYRGVVIINRKKQVRN